MMFLESRDRREHGESRMLAGLIHRGRWCCQHKVIKGKDRLQMRPANE
jgi:hypothetical protein